MIVVIWIIAIMSLALIIGEIKYSCEYRKGRSVNQNIFMRNWNDSIDRDIDALGMEQLKSFESMLIDEYSRKL